MSRSVAKFYEKDGLLWFHLLVASTADIVAAPYEFDGPATSHHIESYKQAYRDFVESKRIDTEALIQAKIKEAIELKDAHRNGHIES